MAFLNTLENGLKLLNDTFRKTKAAGSDTIDGAEAHKLHSTYGIPVEITDNIQGMMWAKFFAYACAATIASLSRSRAGVIAQAAGGTFFVSAVIDECTRVVTALGYPPLPAFNSAGQISALFSQTNSAYGPSMLIDMEDGRPTEGEHTIGDLAERAAQAGISAPLLTSFCSREAIP